MSGVANRLGENLVKKMTLYETKEAPRLVEISKDALIQFKREYQRYKRNLMIANPDVDGWEEIPHLSKADCIDEELLLTICEFGFRGRMDQFDEEELPPDNRNNN